MVLGITIHHKGNMFQKPLKEKVPHTGFVESTGCSPAARAKVHFDRKSSLLMGKRYAKVYTDLFAKP